MKDCPECGRPAEPSGVHDARDNGGEKFRVWDHDPDATIQDDWCAEVLEE